jgi:hypothetical protein
LSWSWSGLIIVVIIIVLFFFIIIIIIIIIIIVIIVIIPLTARARPLVTAVSMSPVLLMGRVASASTDPEVSGQRSESLGTPAAGLGGMIGIGMIVSA